MSVYAVCYDLNSPGQNYEPLIEAIKQQGSLWWHYLDSTWLVVSTKTAVQIRDSLNAYLDSNDELLVVRLSAEWASSGFNAKASEWLKANL